MKKVFPIGNLTRENPVSQQFSNFNGEYFIYVDTYFILDSRITFSR